MKELKTRSWLYSAGIRAVKTMAQTGIAVIGTNATLGSINWAVVGSTVAVAGILSILTSLKGLPEVDRLDLTDIEIAEYNDLGDDDDA